MLFNKHFMTPQCVHHHFILFIIQLLSVMDALGAPEIQLYVEEEVPMLKERPEVEQELGCGKSPWVPQSDFLFFFQRHISSIMVVIK